MQDTRINSNNGRRFSPLIHMEETLRNEKHGPEKDTKGELLPLCFMRTQLRIHGFVIFFFPACHQSSGNLLYTSVFILLVSFSRVLRKTLIASQRFFD